MPQNEKKIQDVIPLSLSVTENQGIQINILYVVDCQDSGSTAIHRAGTEAGAPLM